MASADEGLTLSREGESDYVIVTPNEATPVERTAARELCEHLAKVTGAVLPVVSEDDAPRGRPRIAVGSGALTRRLLPGFDPTKLSPDAIVIKTVGLERHGPTHAEHAHHLGVPQLSARRLRRNRRKPLAGVHATAL